MSAIEQFVSNFVTGAAHILENLKYLIFIVVSFCGFCILLLSIENPFRHVQPPPKTQPPPIVKPEPRRTPHSRRPAPQKKQPKVNPPSASPKLQFARFA